MKIQINLATRPFVELRPLFARLRLAMAALAVLAAALGFTLHTMNAKANDAKLKMGVLKDKTQHYQNEKAANEARMRQPQNAAVLERSKFLNDLFARKSFSWTAVMMDLEDVLPAGVQVTSIEPNITAEGDVNIRLKVSGDRDRAVQLIRNLETSKRFLSPRLSDESMQAQNQGAQRPVTAPGAVEFDILSGYNPLPAKRKSDANAKAAADTAPSKTPNKTSSNTSKTAAKTAAAKGTKPAVPKAGSKPLTPEAKTPAKAAPVAGGKR